MNIGHSIGMRYGALYMFEGMQIMSELSQASNSLNMTNLNITKCPNSDLS